MKREYIYQSIVTLILGCLYRFAIPWSITDRDIVTLNISTFWMSLLIFFVMHFWLDITEHKIENTVNKFGRWVKKIWSKLTKTQRILLIIITIHMVIYTLDQWVLYLYGIPTIISSCCLITSSLWIPKAIKLMDKRRKRKKQYALIIKKPKVFYPPKQYSHTELSIQKLFNNANKKYILTTNSDKGKQDHIIFYDPTTNKITFEYIVETGEFYIAFEMTQSQQSTMELRNLWVKYAKKHYQININPGKIYNQVCSILIWQKVRNNIVNGEMHEIS